MTATPTAPPAGTSPMSAMPLVGSADSGLDLPLPGPTPVSTATATGVRTDAGVGVLLVEELDQVATHVRELLHDDPDVHLLETVHEGHLAMERVVAAHPDVVVIDALLQGKVSGLGVARQMRESGLDTPIIFMTVPERPLTLNADMGIAETVKLPFDGPALLAAIGRVDSAHRGPVSVPPSGTVAVFSAKGGVGRTTVAHNLAVALDGLPVTRAVLVDGDLVHGDLRLHLEAPQEAPSLLQLPTGHVTDVDIAPLLWQDAAGMNILLAPPRMEQADLIMLADIRNALSILRRLHDVVVIDVPAVMDDRTLAMLDDADVVVDVVTTERGAVRKCQRCHAVLRAADFPMEKIVTVINQADATDAAMQAMAAALGRQPAASLPYDERLSGDGLTAGAAIVSADPVAPLSRSFVELAKLIATRVGAVKPQIAARAA